MLCHYAMAVLALGSLTTLAADGVGLSTLLEARSAVTRATNLLLARQRADGSWAGDPAATAQVLIALANAPGRDSDPRPAAACANAAAYLRQAAEAALKPAGDDPRGASADVLATLLPALARAGVAAHQTLLSAGRSRLLSVAVPVDLADGSRALAFAPGPGAAAEVRTTCAAVEALLVTEGLPPEWDAGHYRDLARYLRERLTALRQGAADPLRTRAGDQRQPIPPERQAEAAALARALLCLGAIPTEPPLPEALACLTVAPPRDPIALFALAEAWTLAGTAVPEVLTAPLRAWPDRLIEALLDSQMGDGGWGAPRETHSRDHATAAALRTIQVAAGRHLAETPAVRP